MIVWYGMHTLSWCCMVYYGMVWKCWRVWYGNVSIWCGHYGRVGGGQYGSVGGGQYGSVGGGQYGMVGCEQYGSVGCGQYGRVG